MDQHARKATTPRRDQSDAYAPDDTSPPGHTANIADQYVDLLRFLTPTQRAGMVARLTIGYFDGWRPTRMELADVIANEVGLLTWEQTATRQRQRQTGIEPSSITPALRAWYREAIDRRRRQHWTATVGRR